MEQEATTSTRSSSRIQQNPKKNAQEGEKNVRNYNKPWTVEEQRHLEELLLEFQPEENEAARWRKIATKLGTRTPLQVQSHCQKYFIKLAKAGLPIPGRMPNLKTYVTKKGTRGNRRGGAGGGRARMNNPNSRRMVGRGSSLNEISSMWTSFNPPITMNEDNENELNQDLDNEYENEDDNEEYDENEEEYEEDYDENANQFEDDSYNNENLNQSPSISQ